MVKSKEKRIQCGVIYDHKVNLCKILFNNCYEKTDIYDKKMFICSPNGKITIKKINFMYEIQFSKNKTDKRLYGIMRDEWDCVMNGISVFYY